MAKKTGASGKLDGKRRLRSREWFDAPGDPTMAALYLERYMNFGLTREELGVLLEALGVLENSPYASLPEHLGELKVETLPEPRERGGGKRHVYRFQLREFDTTLVPLVDAGLAQIAAALRAWTSDARVTVAARFGGDDPRTVTYE